MLSVSALGDYVQSLATNSGRVQPTSSPEFVLDGFGHKFADWILNDYWMMFAPSGYIKWRDRADWSF